MHAEICPICRGEGKVISKTSTGFSTWPVIDTCYGCNGKGWIEVKDEEFPTFVPTIPTEAKTI